MDSLWVISKKNEINKNFKVFLLWNSYAKHIMMVQIEIMYFKGFRKISSFVETTYRDPSFCIILQD